MQNRITTLLIPLAVAAIGTAGPAVAQTSPATPAQDPAAMVDLAPHASMSFLPEGIELHARLLQPIGLTENAKDVFVRAELIEPVRTAEGEVVLPAGTILSGTADGPVMADGPHPALLRIDFDAVTYEGLTYPISSRVASVDLAVTDGDTPTPAASRSAIAGSDEARTAGAIVSDPQGTLSSLEFAFEKGTIISLGDSPDPLLPAGTRLMVRLVQDAELHSSPS